MLLRSQRLIGEKGRGATLTADEAVEMLAELNTFMESAQTERLNCYAVQQDSFALTASTSSFTIGVNGTFNIPRPTKIVDPCFVRDSAGYDSQLEIIGADAYGKISVKSVGYTYPTYLFYDYGYSATSTATINLYPSPSGGLTLFINSWKALQNFSSVSQTLMLPPGYQLFIESNFAVHLAAGQVPITPELAKMARDSRAAVKSLNVPDTMMMLDSVPIYRRSSILTGP